MRVNEARSGVRRKMYEYEENRKSKARQSNEKRLDRNKVKDQQQDEDDKTETMNEIVESQSFDINHDEVLKAMKWNYYSDAVDNCSLNEFEALLSLIKASMPKSFIRYSCELIAEELALHQETGKWSERCILEGLFFSLTGLSDEQILNEEEWRSHPLVQHDTWFSEADHCNWGGVTCGITTIGVGGGNLENTFDNMDASDSVEECLASRLRARQRNRCNGKRKLDGWTCERCPPRKKVTKIDLTMLAFPGVLPSNLYMLTYLYRLNVMGNSIVNGIPNTYQRFKYLEFIDVSKNQMSGHLPNQLPGSMTELWCVAIIHAFFLMLP